MNVPKLRFPGFDREWQQDSLGNLTTSYSGGTPKSSNKSYYTGNIPFIRSGEINSSTTELFINEEGLNSSSAKMVDKGDILYALYGATSGEVGISRINGAINQAILCIKPLEQLNKLYLKDFLEGYKSKIISTYLQGGQGNLSGNIIKEISIPFPSLKEQEKLALFFDTFTRKIQLQQEKIDLLKEQKKGFLQKMFPQVGETQPKMRFDEFTGDWKLRKLGELVKINSGWSPSNFDETDKLGNLFIKVDDLNYSSRLQLNSNMKVNIHPKYTKIRKGSIIFPKRGAAIMTNKVRILGKDSYMDTNMMALEPNEIDTDFLYTFIDRTGLYKIADTSTIPQINNKHIEPYEIQTPELKEQRKIGSFFKKIDDAIELQQKKLELIQKQKQSFMQQMFI